MRNILAALALLSLTACAGYRLGSMLPADVQTVSVPTFVNKTKEPLLENDTTAATIRELQTDGSLTVVSEEEADAILTVELTEYTLTPVAYRRNDRTGAREYRATVFASITLTRRGTGAVIAQNPRVKGETVFDLVGDLSSAKLTSVRALSEDLAHNIVEKVVEAWQ